MCLKYYIGRRVALRPLELTDGPTICRWLNDPHVWRTLNRFLPLNDLREREYLEKLYEQSDNLAFGIILRSSERLIGLTGLHRIDPFSRSATFGLIVGQRDYQSRGYGGEVTRLVVRYGFEELNLNRISLTVFDDNEPGIRAYRKAGFVEEGRARQAYYRNGRYHDELLFGLLRSDWQRTTDEEPVQIEVGTNGSPVGASPLLAPIVE